MWVEVNFKEIQLCYMCLGQEVELKLDLYVGDVKYKGCIQSLGLGIGLVFLLLLVQNVSGNWIKIVQCVLVCIVIDVKQLVEYLLCIGLLMKVEVSLCDQKGEVLLSILVKGMVFDIDVYVKQLYDVDEVIYMIIQGNLLQ